VILEKLQPSSGFNEITVSEGRDYKIRNARKLNQNEYTYNVTQGIFHCNND
jgi:phage-related protein